VPTLR